MGFEIDEDENIERIAETTGLSTDSTEQLRDSFSEKFLSEGHSAFKGTFSMKRCMRSWPVFVH